MKCKHNFKIIEDRIISYNRSFSKLREYWQIRTLRCSICGDLKHFRHSLGDHFDDPIPKAKEGESK